MRVRPRAVAGRSYPADPEQVRDLVDRLLREAGCELHLARPVAVVAPHAGYPSSGAVARAVDDDARSQPPRSPGVAVDDRPA